MLQNETELEWEEHPSNPEGKIAIIPLGRLQTEGSIQSPINNPKGGIFDPDETKILVTKLGLNQTVQVLTRGAVTPEFCFEFNEQTQTIMNYRNENPLCTSDVVIPSTKNGVEVKIINDTAFGSKNLTSVIIPNTVEIIGLAAFWWNQLTSVEIPNSVKSLGDEAFAYGQLISVTLPNSLNYIGSEAFAENQLLRVDIPNGVKTIGYGAFNWNQLTNVKIAKSVTTIEAKAFYMNQLTHINIPNSVTTIGRSAFGDNNISTIIIESSGVSIGNNMLGNNSFKEAYSIGGAGTYVGTQTGTWTKVEN